MIILGIESSCDETAAAVLADGEKLLADIVNSQISVHSRYGGVVPEIASRKHVEAIYPVVDAAMRQAGITLDQVDGMAVTRGPGLVGSLLVGLSFVKAISFVKKIPYVGVDHMAGHLLSVFFADRKPDFPFVALLASGGHTGLYYVSDPLTYRLLGRTRDDAAGEAFDKVAKLLGLPYPGGPAISRLARAGAPDAISFPRARLGPDSLDFSFSGLKTAVMNYVRGKKKGGAALHIPDICASFQEAVADVLIEKAVKAVRECGAERLVLAGGVAANDRIRQLIESSGQENSIKVFMPPINFCTDNAAMIALAGYHRFKAEATYSFGMDVYSRSPVVNQ